MSLDFCNYKLSSILQTKLALIFCIFFILTVGHSHSEYLIIQPTPCLSLCPPSSDVMYCTVYSSLYPMLLRMHEFHFCTIFGKFQLFKDVLNRYPTVPESSDAGPRTGHGNGGYLPIWKTAFARLYTAFKISKMLNSGPIRAAFVFKDEYIGLEICAVHP